LRTDLSKLKVGESAVVVELLPHALTVKLSEMGLFKGKRITVLFKAPLGDPIAIDIGGYILSLRKDEACIVAVEK